VKNQSLLVLKGLESLFPHSLASIRD
jgi:hypothetical protein